MLQESGHLLDPEMTLNHYNLGFAFVPSESPQFTRMCFVVVVNCSDGGVVLLPEYKYEEDKQREKYRHVIHRP